MLAPIEWKTTSEDYKRFLYKYGIVPVLCVLECCEEIEMYEECQKIVTSISNHNKLVNNNLPTKYYKGYIPELRNELEKEGIKNIDFEFYTKKMLLDILEMNKTITMK